MKFGAFLSSRIATTLAALGLSLSLGGCEQLANFHFPGMESAPPKQPVQYKPLDSEIAAMAAPLPEGVQGKTVYCTVGKGAAKFPGGKWLDFKDTDFSLPPKQRVTINLPSKTGAVSTPAPFEGFFDEDGQKMVFCPVVSGAPDMRIACTSLYALDDDLSIGIKRTFDVPEALRGGAISCADTLAHVQKL